MGVYQLGTFLKEKVEVVTVEIYVEIYVTMEKLDPGRVFNAYAIKGWSLFLNTF